MNSFKVSIINSNIVNKNTLTFNWTVTDASGNVFSNSLLQTYNNSMGIPTKYFSRNNQYLVEVNVTGGFAFGYAKAIYYTEFDMSFEFHVEPSTGTALDTVFTLSVTS